VLVLETNPILLTVLEYRLRKYGFALTAARNGREALEKIHHQSVDLFVTGLHLPDFKLVTFIELIRQDLKSDIPIILTADLDDHEALLEGIDAGANDFISIPFRPAELVMRIELLLRNINVY
jgi:DNA-binding response OmpR family regulator